MSIIQGLQNTENLKPKHTIFDSIKFNKGRESLGNLILQDMKTTGGTDVDWLIEHRGGFIVLELKEFTGDHIGIPIGQMIAFEKLHERLSSGGKCVFLIVGSDNIDFKNPDLTIRIIDMNDWRENGIPCEKNTDQKRYIIQRKHMHEISLREFRSKIEFHWNEFESM